MRGRVMYTVFYWCGDKIRFFKGGWVQGDDGKSLINKELYTYIMYSLKNIFIYAFFIF